MDKQQLIDALEEYWFLQQKQYPEELMDITSAKAFYHAQSYAYVLQEYNALIG